MEQLSGLHAISLADAIATRRSTRRFMTTDVSDEIISAIIGDSARAPSNTNTQPWLVHVVRGAAKTRLSAAARKAAVEGAVCPEFRYAPDTFDEPFRARRRKVGFDLYALYGIDLNDMEGRREAMLRNYDFFGASVGIFIAMDRRLELGSWLDIGMYMQTLMLAARAYGLDTCPQLAWCDVGGVIHRELDIPETQIILSGMSLGFADHNASENGLRTDRAPVEDFLIWHR